MKYADLSGDDIQNVSIEWENAKCRWAAYFGMWPDWVDGVMVPDTADVLLLRRQFNERRKSWRLIDKVVASGV